MLYLQAGITCFHWYPTTRTFWPKFKSRQVKLLVPSSNASTELQQSIRPEDNHYAVIWSAAVENCHLAKHPLNVHINLKIPLSVWESKTRTACRGRNSCYRHFYWIYFLTVNLCQWLWLYLFHQVTIKFLNFSCNISNVTLHAMYVTV